MPLNVQKVKWGHLLQAGSTLRTNPPRGAVADDVFAAWVLGPAARVPKRSTRTGLQAVLFDLDGVLVDTAEFHYHAWKRLADELGVPFDRQMNHGFRGVGRMECLEKLLGDHARCFVAEEQQMLADRKNAHYLEQVRTLTPEDLEDGARGLAMGLRALSDGGVRLAVVSASKNARLVLSLLRIEDWFDAIIDGGDVTRGKPDPQCFLLAAERLRVRPEACVVVEDADAGLMAARAAGMASVGVGNGVGACDLHVNGVGELTIEQLETLAQRQLKPA
jgi:alpha,alpha-trehalose phosphorylase